MIEVALRTLVKQYADVGESVMPSTEIGDVAKALPKVGYTLIGSPRRMSDSGPTRLVTARYQLDVFAAKLAAVSVGARAIADAIRVGLNGYRGTVDGTRIDLIRFDDDSFGATAPAAGANTAAVRFQQDVFVTYRE